MFYLFFFEERNTINGGCLGDFPGTPAKCQAGLRVDLEPRDPGQLGG